MEKGKGKGVGRGTVKRKVEEANNLRKKKIRLSNSEVELTQSRQLIASFHQRVHHRVSMQ